MSQHLSLPKDKIRFLLLEGVHQNAIDTLTAAGYTNIDYHKTALEGDALKEAVKEAILEGDIPNEYQAAYDFVIKRAEKLGLKKV